MGMHELDPRTLGLVYGRDAFSRQDEGDDRTFYRQERFVDHLDATALSTVRQVIGSLVTEEHPVILDLMAGPDSHLPAGLSPARIVGLGLNQNELESNPALDERVVHDLNRDPVLPFEDGVFDVVLNVISVQYLTRPFEVFSEVARVLAPGGLHLVVFSNRMFEQKAVKIWRQAGSEERVWMVEDFFADGGFGQPQVFVSEGLPRPEDDKYAELGIPSDPVYAVYAEAPGGDPARVQRPAPRITHGFEVDPDVVAARKERVHETLRCPYCDQPLTRWEVPDTPFVQWEDEFVWVCFNNRCPYMLEGWEAMRRQGNPGFTYRLMYLPGRNVCKPTPQPSIQAMRDTVIHERG